MIAQAPRLSCAGISTWRAEPSHRIETLDLVHSCPIWSHDEPYRQPPFMRHLFDVRQRWSFKTLEIAPPISHWAFHAKSYNFHADLHSSTLGLLYWKCRSEWFWRIVGPKELMDDLIWIDREVVGGRVHALSFHLCQHEIRGD
jgi:hypothetical protein